MKLSLKEVFYLSRPRFWMYVLGTFLVGMIAAGNPFEHGPLTTILLLSFSVFFSLPANVLIYGVNDIYDYQTDIHNEKKLAYESILQPNKHRNLWVITSLLILPFLLLFIWSNTPTKIALMVFLFTGIFYSATPIRAKSKPPLDVLFSSIIYVSPAVVGYFVTGQTNIEWLAVVGGLIWAFAMQTYSAVPDIDADQKAGVHTLATLFGEKKALWFCLVCYLLSASIGFYYLGPIAVVFGVVYLAMVLLSIYNTNKLFKYYTYFPLINVITGALLFFNLFYQEVFV